MRAPRQLSRDILLIKCLELGVAMGVAMECCSVFYTFVIYGHFPLMGTLWSQGARIREARVNSIIGKGLISIVSKGLLAASLWL